MGGKVLKRLILIALFLLMTVPVTIGLSQDDGEATPMPSLEITGVNATDLPTALITTNVVDSFGQPITNLGVDDFILTGDLAGVGEIIDVQNITDDNLSFAVVLVIDTSSSMAGTPLAQSQEAARIFINNLGENDPVAIVTFNTSARLVQDYTTDRDVLLAAIDTLGFGGQTALYDATVLAVDVATRAPTPRRAIVLLSDGAEYGGEGGIPASFNDRDTAVNAGIIRGVPIYTIGLGYGTNLDRIYLEEVSGLTNASNFESPTPAELPSIYDALSQNLRSQYVVTISADVPFDGAEYGFALQSDTSEGLTNEASAVLRAPIPVPIITVDGLPEGEITEPTTITVNILADDDIAEVTLNDEATELTDNALTVAINPVDLMPGSYSVPVSVTDVDGDATALSIDYTIGALPSDVSISPDTSDLTIAEPTSFELTITGQTLPTTVDVSLGGTSIDLGTGDTVPFVIDPFLFQPGEQTLAITVTNEGGVTSTTEASVSIVALPPEVTITGIEEGAVFEGSFLPDDSVSILVDATSQTAITDVVISVDGNEVTTLSEAPYIADIDFLNTLGSGEHTVDVTVNNEGGASTTESIGFMLTIIPTATIVPTETNTPEPTVDTQATTNAQSTSDAFATTDAQSTLDTEGTFEANAQATAEIQGTLDAQSTLEAASNATLDAQATVDMQLTGDAQATLDMQATADNEVAESTLNVEQTIVAEQASIQQTQDEQATYDADATLFADSQQTQLALETEAAEQTEEANAAIQQTQEAQETLDAEMTTVADASVQQTQDAQETLDAEMTTVADAVDQLTLEAQETIDTQAQIDAQVELDAQATLTALAEITEDATVEPTIEPTEELTDEPTVDAPQATATEVVITDEFDAQQADEDSGLPLGLIIGGIALLIVIIFLIMFFTQRREE